MYDCRSQIIVEETKEWNLEAKRSVRRLKKL